MPDKKKLLVAPLNWGLGHATRCIPIINALIKENFEPIIASDGTALALLKIEFPALTHVALPSYNISYSKNSKNLKWRFLLNSPKVLKAVKSEKKQVSKLIKNLGIVGIISDNRFGVYHKDIVSVYITHQLNVLSGNTSWLSSRIHQNIIKKYDECWIPDFDDETNYSGRLGHMKSFNVPLKYLGVLSRLKKETRPLKHDLTIVLSGPEPQRSILENKLLKQLDVYPKKVVLIRGVIEREQSKIINGNLTIYNFMTSTELERTINESALILSRSGYTSILDLAQLHKKAFFIPTPGQYEQEYLAKRLQDHGIIPFSPQDSFSLEQLKLTDQFSGFKSMEKPTDFKALFSLFEGE